MTSPIETNNVVERLREEARIHQMYSSAVVDARACVEWQAAEEIERLRSERQSLSDRIDVQSALLGRARWLMRPYCGADEALRIFCDDVTASLTQGGNTNG